MEPNFLEVNSSSYNMKRKLKPLNTKQKQKEIGFLYSGVLCKRYFNVKGLEVFSNAYSII
jgi:hypothetical protein